jgi:hypothetical protein
MPSSRRVISPRRKDSLLLCRLVFKPVHSHFTIAFVHQRQASYGAKYGILNEQFSRKRRLEGVACLAYRTKDSMVGMNQEPNSV